MEEAYRTIKVTEGKRQINIPTAKAVIRALAVNAARGQLRSQQAFTKLLTETERARKALTDRMFDAALDYKLKWDEKLERRKRLGITGPAPLPHPDDVHLNFRTSQVTFIGPLTKEGKAQWDRLHDLLEKADRELETMRGHRHGGQQRLELHADLAPEQRQPHDLRDPGRRGRPEFDRRHRHLHRRPAGVGLGYGTGGAVTRHRQ